MSPSFAISLCAVSDFMKTYKVYLGSTEPAGRTRSYIVPAEGFPTKVSITLEKT